MAKLKWKSEWHLRLYNFRICKLKMFAVSGEYQIRGGIVGTIWLPMSAKKKQSEPSGMGFFPLKTTLGYLCPPVFIFLPLSHNGEPELAEILNTKWEDFYVTFAMFLIDIILAIFVSKLYSCKPFLYSKVFMSVKDITWLLNSVRFLWRLSWIGTH